MIGFNLYNLISDIAACLSVVITKILSIISKLTAVDFILPIRTVGMIVAPLAHVNAGLGLRATRELVFSAGLFDT